MAKIRISENGDTFNQNEFVVDKRERAKSCLNLLRTFQESLYNSSGIDQCCRSLTSTVEVMDPANIQLRFLSIKRLCI